LAQVNSAISAGLTFSTTVRRGSSSTTLSPHYASHIIGKMHTNRVQALLGKVFGLVQRTVAKGERKDHGWAGTFGPGFLVDSDWFETTSFMRRKASVNIPAFGYINNKDHRLVEPESLGRARKIRALHHSLPSLPRHVRQSEWQQHDESVLQSIRKRSQPAGPLADEPKTPRSRVERGAKAVQCRKRAYQY
jgi:hypothetical protein